MYTYFKKKWIPAFTVKLGDKERFDKKQIVVKEPFSVTKKFLITKVDCILQQKDGHLLHKDKEHLVLSNNFNVTKKFLITKFDCILQQKDGHLFFQNIT